MTGIVRETGPVDVALLRAELAAWWADPQPDKFSGKTPGRIAGGCWKLHKDSAEHGNECELGNHELGNHELGNHELGIQLSLHRASPNRAPRHLRRARTRPNGAQDDAIVGTPPLQH